MVRRGLRCQVAIAWRVGERLAFRRRIGLRDRIDRKHFHKQWLFSSEAASGRKSLVHVLASRLRGVAKFQSLDDR